MKRNKSFERLLPAVLRCLAIVGISFITTTSTRAQSDIPAEERKALERAYPNWKVIVRSPSYADWLNSQPPGIQELADSRNPEGAIRLLNTFQRFRIESGQSGTFKLSCSLQSASGSPNAYKTDSVFWIDTLTSKVSGYPAIISDDYIEYVNDAKDRQRTIINRQTGSIQVGDSTFPVFAQGACNKVGPKQF